MPISHLRREYVHAALNEDQVDPDPIRQFRHWFDQARKTEIMDPNAMTLATCGADGQPSARTVLLKGIDERGFVFYTNYQSRKGRQLVENPRASLLFYWDRLGRQVEVAGPVSRTTREEAEAYFRSRPLESQFAALASAQSAVIPGRAPLEARVAELRRQYQGRPVPLPEQWGGFRVEPHTIEFWQGREARLHDRLRYTRLQQGGWRLERLSP